MEGEYLGIIPIDISFFVIIIIVTISIVFVVIVLLSSSSSSSSNNSSSTIPLFKHDTHRSLYRLQIIDYKM